VRWALHMRRAKRILLGMTLAAPSPLCSVKFSIHRLRRKAIIPWRQNTRRTKISAPAMVRGGLFSESTSPLQLTVPSLLKLFEFVLHVFTVT
jgi:hypothetical protein